MGCGSTKATTASTKDSTSLPKKDVKAGAIAHDAFILENTGKISEFYELDTKKLGVGSYGTVCKAKNKSTKAVRAVKIVAKAKMKTVERFKIEVALMKMMDHPNIIKLFETFEDARSIYLIMELCAGGELFDRIVEAGHFSEAIAAHLMQQIVRAIYYMHEHLVTHRDLKPENFLFVDKGPLDASTVKIIDFGLACKFEPGQLLKTKAGTPYYVSPQVLSGSYDHSADVWSVGVIMYVMLCGYPPFGGEQDEDVLAKVRLGNFSFPSKEWKNISDDAKELIRHMLKLNPKERFTAQQALTHDWIKKKAPKAAPIALQANFVDKLRGFRSQHKLKKAALHVIAGQLHDDQIKELRAIFLALDDNGDGLLTLQEMKQGLEKSGLKEIPADLKQIMEDVDSDGSGVIDYTEFLAATLDQRSYLKEDVCWAAFRIFDLNGDGKISKDELRQVLGNGDVQDMVGGKEGIEDLIKSIDKNGDGEIDFEEFMAMMRGNGLGDDVDTV
mmetsp:Transcript_121632/g.242308  ORF Transcript_121632/g.242308 Transcript_121632/m.242308 type:complete len:500 (-) Transcript_121632:244-1743(-)